MRPPPLNMGWWLGVFRRGGFNRRLGADERRFHLDHELHSETRMGVGTTNPSKGTNGAVHFCPIGSLSCSSSAISASSAGDTFPGVSSRRVFVSKRILANRS